MLCNRPSPEASWLSSISVQSHVSLCAQYQTTAISAQLITVLAPEKAPSNRTNRIIAIPVTTASGKAKSDAYSIPCSIEMRAISTAAMMNNAKITVSRAAYWP
ncbi:MAG: hypothetical protein FJ276_22715 [Planctomycetes bacterium]|nr:hypothetical protein [Planctomycetota bacterium]